MQGVYIKTFGCQMNEYDTEKIYALLSDKFKPVNELDQANLVIVNTCSVRDKAEHKLRSLLGQLGIYKNQRPELIIGIAGCVAQQQGDELIKKNPVVDFVTGTHNLSLIPALVEQARQGSCRTSAVDYREEWEDLPEAFHSYLPESEQNKELNSSFGAFYSPVRALIAVQRGCNKNCSFCVVPETRGPEVSRQVDEILREIRLKVRLGAREVMLLGQTVNSYGRDLVPRTSFSDLIRRVSELEGVKRIRFTSPHPQDVTPDFLRLYSEVDQLCPHIHLPLQSGSDRILKLMNRNYRISRYLEIVQALREQRPDIAISSDFIVAFPTETDDDFEQTLDMIRRIRYNFSYSFIYSSRPRTAAAEMFDSSKGTPEAVARSRLAELQRVQDEISLEYNQRLLGKSVEVLVEGSRMNISSSRRGRIPENTLVELIGAGPPVGELVRATVESASRFGLRGRLN